MKTVAIRFAAIAMALALGPPMLAQTTPTITFTETKLANGLRVILSEGHNAPVYSIVVHYNVGSRDERAGRTGFAHLFEHMMFKGSENVGPGEHFMLKISTTNVTPYKKSVGVASTISRTAKHSSSSTSSRTTILRTNTPSSGR